VVWAAEKAPKSVGRTSQLGQLRRECTSDTKIEGTWEKHKRVRHLATKLREDSFAMERQRGRKSTSAELQRRSGLWAATGMYVREKVKKKYGEGGARGVTFYTVRKGWARRWWSSGSGVL
jgi:hypothetical protein